MAWRNRTKWQKHLRIVSNVEKYVARSDHCFFGYGWWTDKALKKKYFKNVNTRVCVSISKNRWTPYTKSFKQRNTSNISISLYHPNPESNVFFFWFEKLLPSSPIMPQHSQANISPFERQKSWCQYFNEKKGMNDRIYFNHNYVNLFFC